MTVKEQSLVSLLPLLQFILEVGCSDLTGIGLPCCGLEIVTWSL